jgi:hypothetical protein
MEYFCIFHDHLVFRGHLVYLLNILVYFAINLVYFSHFGLMSSEKCGNFIVEE